MPAPTPRLEQPEHAPLPPRFSPDHAFDSRVARLALRGPLLVVARNSGDSKKGRRGAVQDLFEALAHLKSDGLDLMPHLSSAAQLRRMLAAAEAHTAIDVDGHKFTNRFVVIDLRAEANAVILLSTGSAAKRRQDDGKQPFCEKLAQVVWSFQTPLLFGKRVDRWARDKWALADAAGSVAALDGMVGDTIRGWRTVDGFEAMSIFFDATIAEEDSKTGNHKMLGGIVARTDDRMVAGRVRYGSNVVPPPGLALAHLLADDGFGKGGQIMYVDTDTCRPDAGQVFRQLPDSRDASGRPADQVSTVRWVLSVLGRREWPAHRIAEELALRGFSHVDMRRKRGPNATYELPADRKATRYVTRVFKNNLEFYRTGCFTIPLGSEAFSDPTIENIFPPDGPWMADADYERIRAWMDSKDSHRFGGMTLSGVPARLNGTHDVALATGASRTNQKLGPHGYYRLVPRDTYSDGVRTTAPDAAPVPHQEFADSIAEAVATAGSAALALVPPSHSSNIELMEVRRDMRHLESEMEQLKQQRSLYWSRIMATGSDDVKPITGAALSKANEKYNEIEERLLPDAESRHRRLTARAAELLQPRSRESDVDRLLRLVASLRDPCDTTLRHVWRSVVVDVEFSVEMTRPLAKLQRRELRWSGVLEFTHGDEAVRIPFSGSYADGAATEIDERLDAIVSGIRDGTPFNEIPVASKRSLQRPAGERIAADLGIDLVDARALLSITDPRCLRAWVDALDPQAEVTEDRRDMAERAELAITESPVRGNTRAWLQPVRHDVHEMYLWLARSSDGVVATRDCPDGIANIQHTRAWLKDSFVADEWDLDTYGEIRLEACQGCGGHRRILLKLLEPDGSVCADCRLDRSGRSWPADPYDHYAHEVAAYIKAGLTEAMPAAPPTVRGSSRKPLRHPKDFSDEDREGIVRDYTENRLTVEEICERRRCRKAELYRLVKAAGATLRSKRKRKKLEAWDERNG